MRNPKDWFYDRIDKYILEHHGTEFIHREKVQPIIESEKKETERVVNVRRDRREQELLQNRDDEHFVELAGWKARCNELQQFIDESMDIRKNVERLRISYKERNESLFRTAVFLYKEAETLHESTGRIIAAIGTVKNEAEANMVAYNKRDQDEKDAIGYPFLPKIQYSGYEREEEK